MSSAQGDPTRSVKKKCRASYVTVHAFSFVSERLHPYGADAIVM